MNKYSPYTGEFMPNGGPDWLESTDIPVPSHDQTTHTPFFKGGQWVLVQNNQPEPRDIKAEIAALESQSMLPRPIRESTLKMMEATFTPDVLSEDQSYIKMKMLDEQIKLLRVQIT